VKIASEGSKYPRKAPPQRIDRRRDRVLHLVCSVPRYVAAKGHGINRHFAIKIHPGGLSRALAAFNDSNSPPIRERRPKNR
jgi:hypothetical protein